eukprot:gene134-183_t
MKRATIQLVQIIVFLLFSCLILNSCIHPHEMKTSNKTTRSADASPDSSQATSTKSAGAESEVNETIMFYGSPGVGKSALCNAIFQKAIFKSEVSSLAGTTAQQTYQYEDKLYIDTPGLHDIQMRKQAAEEIEKALKYNHHYKIIFVATLEAGRIRPDDLVTINLICDIIQTPFEYGLTFNKLTDYVYQDIIENGLNEYLITLHKQPSSIALLKEINDMKDAPGKYFQDRSDNRDRLLNFISTLRSSKIRANEVKAIDIRDFDEKIQEMEEEYNREVTELNKKIIEQNVQISAMQKQQENSAKELFLQAGIFVLKVARKVLDHHAPTIDIKRP